jgi:hypothetical protein
MFNRNHFDHRFDLLELYLTVRDPGTAKSAEAYDGLRKLLINANRGFQVHLAHLAELHRVVSSAESIDVVRAKVGEFMNQVGLAPVWEPEDPELFEITGRRGSVVVVDSPAYVSRSETGVAFVVRGSAHYDSREAGANEIDNPAVLHDSVTTGLSAQQVVETADQEEVS